MITQQYQELLKNHLAAENAHQLAATLMTLAEDCIFDDKALERVFQGRQGAAEYYQAWWQGFNMTVHTEKRYYPEPELVIVETRFKGKHVGDFFGLKPSLRHIDIPLAIFIDLKDGLMAGERFYWNKTSLLSQLAIAPEAWLN